MKYIPTILSLLLALIMLDMEAHKKPPRIGLNFEAGPFLTTLVWPKSMQYSLNDERSIASPTAMVRIIYFFRTVNDLEAKKKSY